MLSIMTAPSLEAAISLQNAVDYGLTAGIHSLDEVEVNDWMVRVQAGNLYVNRGITGAIVQRQPFGGWKRSAIGPTTKAGGPNYLLSLMGFRTSESQHEEEIKNPAVEAALALAAESDLTDSEMASLLRAAQSDQQALREHFGRSTDESALAVERNVLRYHRSGCSLRVSSTADNYSQWRTALTLLALGKTELSAFEVPKRLRKLLSKAGVAIRVESDQAWLDRVQAPSRWRYVGAKLSATQGSVLANCELTVYANPVTESGVVELLPYFKEQSVSVTAHRFGNPNKLAKQISL
jgi:RHH-type proline utilization regulon transcriptional repressor/proline dehydrogenase/delta 1-pyrroline-5-carboxylate dehydrogenase